jgi:hypothetical protein
MKSRVQLTQRIYLLMTKMLKEYPVPWNVFIVYLTMLSVAQILQNDWMTVNKDLEGDFSRHI